MSNIIQSSGTTVLSNAGAKLDNLADRHSKAKGVYQSIMNAVNEKGVDDDLYKKIVDLLGRFKKTQKTFNEERSPITTAIDSLKKPFIDIELDFDLKKNGSMAFELKKLADAYAQKKQKEEEKRNTQIRKQQAYDNELNGLSIKAEIYIKKCLLNLETKLKSDIDTLINSVDVQNHVDIRENIMTMDTDIPPTIFQGFVKETITVYVGDVEKQTKFTAAMDGDIYLNARTAFETNIFQYQQLAVQKIPAIIEELNEIASAETQEQKQELVQAKAEREVSEQQQQQADAASKTQELVQEEATKEAAHNLQSSFNFGAAQAEVKKDDIKKKVNYVIELVLPAGLQEIFKFWVTHADIGTDEKKIRNWTIDRMIRFAEKECNKNDNKIVSQYVIYRESVEAKV